jgi:benzoylformate decarboxylase
MNGADWLLAALAAEGMPFLFGNPGSTELPITDALGRQEGVRYVLALHESVAMGMADGHAQVTGRPAAVNVHVQPGLANAMSGILNAARCRVPLIVTVGQQVQEMLPGEPFLGGELVQIARPVTKGAWEVARAADLPEAFARAVRTATTPPRGPVVLSLPLDVQVGEAPRAHVPAAPGPGAPPRGPPGGLACPGDPRRRRRHPRGRGRRAGPSRGAPRRADPRRADGRVGAPAHRPPPLEGPAPPVRRPDRPGARPLRRRPRRGHARLPPLRLQPRCRPARVGTAGSPRDRPARGGKGPPARGRPGRRGGGRPRGAPRPPGRADSGRPGAARPCRRRAGLARAAVAGHVTPAAFSRAIAGALGPRDLVVDEALTAGRGLRAAVSRRTPATWLAHRGSALGWGLPAAVGAKLADPSRRVMALQGDGSLLFGVSALWTAAHQGLGVALVVADNGGYEILRAGLEGLTGRPEGRWPGISLREPALDIGAICGGFGASSARVERPGDLREALADLWRRTGDGPAVLVVGVEGRAAPVGYPIG